MDASSNMLVNWDGTSNLHSVIEGIERIFRHCLGWTYVKVEIRGPSISIIGENDYDDHYRLIYNTYTNREVYGRVRGILNSEELETIKQVLLSV